MERTKGVPSDITEGSGVCDADAVYGNADAVEGVDGGYDGDNVDDLGDVDDVDGGDVGLLRNVVLDVWIVVMSSSVGALLTVIVRSELMANDVFDATLVLMWIKDS